MICIYLIDLTITQIRRIIWFGTEKDTHYQRKIEHNIT